MTKKLFLKDCFGVAEHKTLAIYPFYFLEKCWFSDFGISFWQSLIYCEELRDDLKLTMCPGYRRTEQSESSRLRLSISLYGYIFIRINLYLDICSCDRWKLVALQ